MRALPIQPAHSTRLEVGLDVHVWRAENAGRVAVSWVSVRGGRRVSWVRLDDNMVDHPKVSSLSDRAFRLQITAISYCNRLETDGKLPRKSAEHLVNPNGKRFVNELVLAGIWEDMGDHYLIHDYLDYQPSKAEIDDLRAKRSAAGTIGGKRSRPPSKPEASASDVLHTMSEAKTKPIPSRTSKESPPTVVTLAAQTTNGRNHEWDALVAVFAYSPTSKADCGLWGRLCVELRAMETWGDIGDWLGEAANRYPRDMPGAVMTPPALVKHAPRLMAMAESDLRDRKFSGAQLIARIREERA